MLTHTRARRNLVCALLAASFAPIQAPCASLRSRDLTLTAASESLRGGWRRGWRPSALLLARHKALRARRLPARCEALRARWPPPLAPRQAWRARRLALLARRKAVRARRLALLARREVLRTRRLPLLTTRCNALRAGPRLLRILARRLSLLLGSARLSTLRLALTGGRLAFPEIRAARRRSEERRVGKECRSRWSP